jgi:NADPH:quinone reductase-like Zn-dependent oxidoreductase
MKAAMFREFGPPEVLKLEEVPTPTAAPGNVVIKILAAGVNRLEHFLRAGEVTRELPLPHVLGSDAAGEIAAVGEGVTGFQPGERVVPMPGYPLLSADDAFTPLSAAPTYAIGGVLRWGTYAQYIEVPARWVVHDTTGLAPELVATLPMVLVTAVRAVRNVGNVKAGSSVLVHAGASGTGSMNIQIAKALGARVIATVDSEEKAKFAADVGADQVIDVRNRDFVADCIEWTDGRGVDVVIDNLGGKILQGSMDATRVGGTIVTMGFVTGNEASFKVREFFFTHKTLRGTLMGDLEDFKFGLDLVSRQLVRPVLDRTFALAEAADAHRMVAQNQVLGNVVLMPWA